MTTDKIRGDNTLVWCVAVLSDMTVVSGDSMGLVKFWDGRMGTQLQSVTAHKADVLTLAVAANGRTIYTSGVDQYVAELAQVPLEDSSGSQQRKTRTQWIRSGYKRYHSHDVRALAVSPALSLRTGSEEPTPDAARPSIVLSGGLDFSLVLMAVKSHRSASDQTQDSPMGATLASTSNPLASVEITTFDASRARKASYIPQRNHPIAFAAEARLLASIREGGVDLWQVGDASNVDQASSGKVLEMNIKVRSRLVLKHAACLSPLVADWLVCTIWNGRVVENKIHEHRAIVRWAVAGSLGPIRDESVQDPHKCEQSIVSRSTFTDLSVRPVLNC